MKNISKKKEGEISFVEKYKLKKVLGAIMFLIGLSSIFFGMIIFFSGIRYFYEPSNARLYSLIIGGVLFIISWVLLHFAVKMGFRPYFNF